VQPAIIRITKNNNNKKNNNNNNNINKPVKWQHQTALQLHCWMSTIAVLHSSIAAQHQTFIMNRHNNHRHHLIASSLA